VSSWIKRIFSLPGVKRTPDVVLAQTTEKLPRIKAVAIAIIWDDDTCDFDWSQMRTSELAWLALSFEQEALKAMRGES
jgi:hypothetical protein